MGPVGLADSAYRAQLLMMIVFTSQQEWRRLNQTAFVGESDNGLESWVHLDMVCATFCSGAGDQLIGRL